MRRLASLIRTSPLSIDNCIRGPKKKGQAQVKIESNEIINIFKQKQDPQPRDIKQYPIFVQQMSLGQYTVHELLYGTQTNIKFMLPTKPTYKSLMRGIKRQRFKAIREYKQLDFMHIEKQEKYEIHERTTLYDLFNKTKEQLEEQRKAAEAAAAAEEDDDDQF